MAQDGVYVFQDPNSGRGNFSDVATIAALNGNGGWGGGMNNPFWMMFMWIGIKQKLRKVYGVTISILSKKLSIVIFNRHKSKDEYISTIVHEAEHIKQDMFKYYNVEDEGEDAAYAIGYIVKQMYSVIKDIICSQ